MKVTGSMGVLGKTAAQQIQAVLGPVEASNLDDFTMYLDFEDPRNPRLGVIIKAPGGYLCAVQDRYKDDRLAQLYDHNGSSLVFHGGARFTEFGIVVESVDVLGLVTRLYSELNINSAASKDQYNSLLELGPSASEEGAAKCAS